MWHLTSQSALYRAQASNYTLFTAFNSIKCSSSKRSNFLVKNSCFILTSTAIQKPCRDLICLIFNSRKSYATKKDFLNIQTTQKKVSVPSVFKKSLSKETGLNKNETRNSIKCSAEIFPHLSGFIVVDKPFGVTSTAIVRFFQSILKCYYEGLSTSTVSMPLPLHQKDVRHRFVKSQPAHLQVGLNGALDPLATGLLVIVIGTATKKLPQFLKGAKEYTVVGRLGNAADSLDSAGSIVLSTPTEHITREILEKGLTNFTGTYHQTPPNYSGLGINGTKLYQKARKPENTDLKVDVEIPLSLVNVEKLELTRFWYEDKLDSIGNVIQSPSFELKLRCSLGFYVRSLVRDLGLVVNSSAYITELRRTSQYPFKLSRDSISLEDCLDLEKFESAVVRTSKLLACI